jgi:Centromere DNA-binding protein complex CBF3 subunit, domain 2
MIMVMGNDKANKQGKLEYAAAMRRCNLLFYIMAQVFYLSYITDRKSRVARANCCSRIAFHLIKGENAEKQMAYDTQLDWINKIFHGANVASLRKTHASRSQGVDR